ncbi:MAG: hypothetical protein JWN30_2886 [Bacilli bacterium]|nr:hypothetical protein [Bacilli bacterium]
MKKDMSWKSFGLSCLAMAALVFVTETAAIYPHSFAAGSKIAAETPPAAAGEQLAPEDVPPPITEQQLPAKLREEKPIRPEYKPITDPAAKTAKLQVTVIDGRTKKPIPNADVVVVETGDRTRTDANGQTPMMNEPVPRDEVGRRLLNRLHGQLAVISYVNGYRDSITIGVRMHEGQITRTTVWQYKIITDATGKLRVEPVLYQVPYHRLYLLQLADAFRASPDEGEGTERPDR